MKYIKKYNEQEDWDTYIKNHREQEDLTNYKTLFKECVEEIKKYFDSISIYGELPDINSNSPFNVWKISKNENILFYIWEDDDEIEHKNKNSSFSTYRELYHEYNDTYLNPEYIMTYELKNIDKLISDANEIKEKCSYEYQKEFLTENPEKYKDLEYFGYAPGIKEEFDWLFNAIDMKLM